MAFRRCGHNRPVRRAAILVLVLLATGCGVSHEPAKQAEDVHSVAAEGALLAHGAAGGDSTGTFTQEHAEALRKLLAPVREAIEDDRLREVADDVDRTLAELAAAPDDSRRAAGAERKLDRLAAAAERVPP
jgi:hypothetical protein